MLKALLILAFCSVAAQAQDQEVVIDLQLDFQTNAVVQLARGFDGSIWGITASSMDRLPTIAGVFAVRSTDEGVTWDTSCVTPDWWRWGLDICPIDAQSAWAFVLRDDVVDTIDCYRTQDGGRTWLPVLPTAVGLGRMFAAEFFSPTVGVIIGMSARAVPGQWIISRTTDAGETWRSDVAMQAHMSESIAARNDRSVARRGQSMAVGLSTGRVMMTHDAGATWSFATPPVGGAVSAITHTDAHGIVAVHTRGNGSNVAMASKDGTSWNPVTLPSNVKHIHGFITLRNGAIATVPNDVTSTPLAVISADLSSATVLKSTGCFGLLELTDGALLTGTEVVPGKGLLRLKQ